MQAKFWVGLVTGLMLLGCNGKPAKEPKKPQKDPPTLSDDGDDDDVPESDELEFDEEMAQTMLKRGERKAQNCVTTNDAPVGEYEIEVTWDGAKGTIVAVDLGYSFEGSSDLAKNCLIKSFKGEMIPPFTGKKTQTFNLKLEAAKPKKD